MHNCVSFVYVTHVRCIVTVNNRGILKHLLKPYTSGCRIWGYSRLQLDPLGGKLFNLVVQKAEPVISQFDSQNVSNFLLAAATLEKPLPEDFLDRIARQATLKMPQASPQGISNLLWAYAKLTKVSPLGGDLFRSALSRASEVHHASFPSAAERQLCSGQDLAQMVAIVLCKQREIVSWGCMDEAECSTAENCFNGYGRASNAPPRNALFAGDGGLHPAECGQPVLGSSAIWAATEPTHAESTCRSSPQEIGECQSYHHRRPADVVRKDGGCLWT